MILWSSKPTTKTPSDWEPREGRLWDWQITAARWHLRATRRFLDRGGADWRHGYNYYTAGVSPKPERWHVGMHHDYYDGPHHVVWVGPFWIAWAPEEWCDTCMPPGDDDTSGAVAAFVEAVLGAAMEAA